ncbi:IS200/IS605 family accessory protein TnpB-related protein, partial [Pseudomonas sp. SIMBA_068]|uniref:IS200/IS605 family accessory protein TnpB-related protein n=1 Tax=Pseudomonas sp. SIMBA_068 TaxID=3085808 RepID=UPI00397A13D0
TYLHQVSAKLARTYSLIAVEALQVKNMTRSAKGTVEAPGKNVAVKAGLNRSISDASWGRLKALLHYKAELNGGRVIEVDPKHTSQICSG